MNEFEIIQKYFIAGIKCQSPYIKVGPGDDCAVVQVPPGDELCVSTDTLIEGVHFPYTAAPEMIAARSCAANLSDLAAVGADPLAMTLALTLPEVSETWLTAFSQALAGFVSTYKLPLAGGDLTHGPLAVTINIMGKVPKGQALLRSGAHDGDDIYVTGSLGSAAAGLTLLEQGDDNYPELTARYTHPEPRLAIGKALRGLVNACIDISDGFLADLQHICQSSNLGATITPEQLPYADSLLSVFDVKAAEQFALSGGDDYELCFCAAKSCRDRIEQISRSHGIAITRLGHMTAQLAPGVYNETGQPLSVHTGYRHF